MLHWHQVYGLPANSIRIFNAYGPRVRTTGAYGAVFGVFFKQKLAGKPFTVIGDGTQRRDFLYVTDVAEAFLRAAETASIGANLESRRRQSAEREPAGRSSLAAPVVYIPKRPGEPDCTWADIAQDPARTRLEAGGAVRRGRQAHDGQTSSSGVTRRCGIRSRSRSRPRRGLSIWAREA